MDLQTMGGKPVTSDNALSHNNLRAHSPQTAGDSRPQPDTPIGLEESWRNANSCARCRSPGCAVPYEDPATERRKPCLRQVGTAPARARKHRSASGTSDSRTVGKKRCGVEGTSGSWWVPPPRLDRS